MTLQPEKFEKEPLVEEIARPRRIDLRPEHLNRTLLVLAAPSVIEYLLHTTVHLSDTLIAGWLRDETLLAASMLAGVLLFITSAPFFALTVAANSLVSRAWGAERYERGRQFAGQCLALAFLFSLAVFLAGMPLAGRLLVWLGAEPEVVPVGATFLRILLCSVLLGSPMWVANGIIRATGDTRTPMVLSLIMNAVNVLVSILLAFGIGPWPGMGLMGVAWGTVVARSLGGLLSVSIAMTRRMGAPLPLSMLWRWRAPMLREIWKIGSPTLLERLIWTGSYSVFASIVARLGTTALAGHNIALHVESLAFMPGNGAAFAISSFVGQAVGAGKTAIAETAVKRTIKWMTLTMAGLGLLFVVFGKQVALLFGATPEVVRLAGIALQISSIEHPLMACGMILVGALQGSGDTRSPLYVIVVCILLFRFGVVYLFAIGLGWGLAGVWLGTAVDWGGRCIGLWWMFKRGRWKTVHAESLLTEA